jgi:hypothetical protein
VLQEHRHRIETSSFFSKMESFGFFNNVQEHLPDEFTIIYEIARILEGLEHPIAAALAPILALNTESNQDILNEQLLIPNVPEAEEYEADLIRSVTEVRSIYPYQFLLPETVFYQRLAERSLWLPRPRVPRNFKYQTESDRFAPDDRKQKVYVLFDTSNSMQQHYRIHLAKAIAYLFLSQNQRELGTVFFRTFDINVGPLEIARDTPSFDRLISTVMHCNARGNGTALQRALVTAIDDISHESQLSSAEILVITDGVAHVDIDMLRQKMSDNITINTVKIGSARMQIDAKVIEDQIYRSNSEDAIRLRELHTQKKDLEHQVSTATGHLRTEGLRAQIGMLTKQIQTLTSRVGEHISEHYGLEIARLSTVYVNVNDILPNEMFSLPEYHVQELEELANELLDALRTDRRVDDIRRAAVLFDHLEMLVQYNINDAPRLAKAAAELQGMLQDIISTPSSQSLDMAINSSERTQLRHMLNSQMFGSKANLAMLLRMLVQKMRRWWRQKKFARVRRRLRV